MAEAQRAGKTVADVEAIQVKEKKVKVKVPMSADKAASFAVCQKALHESRKQKYYDPYLTEHGKEKFVTRYAKEHKRRVAAGEWSDVEV